MSNTNNIYCHFIGTVLSKLGANVTTLILRTLITRSDSEWLFFVDWENQTFTIPCSGWEVLNLEVHTTVSCLTGAVAAANTGVVLSFLRQPSNIRGQCSVAISEELPWKHSWFEPFRFLPAACLQSGSLKVDPGSCQPWAGLWLQACPVRRLRPFVDLGGLRGQLRSYTVKPPRLDPHSANSTYRLPPRLLLPLQSAATSDRPWYIAEHYETCFPLSQQGGLCGVLSSTICAFLQFFLFFSLSPELSTHIALQLRAIRLGAIAKGSASIRVPIIIPNQSHFSI